MVRRLAHGFVFLLLLVPSMASALGLGNVETRSALNEPLEARILLSATAEELENLRVSLATAEAFQRAGLDRPFLLSRLQFDVITDDGSTPYVQVSTENGVREPFVAFLVEVRWSGGRLLREYTVLLDPPVYTPREQAAPVRSADAASPAGRQQQNGSARSAPGRITRPGAVAEARESAAPGEYGPVRRNETAWDIAMTVRPDEGVSVHQMMMALVRANPDAFTDGNANNLRAGAILRIPPRSEIQSLSAAAARREFARQVDAWRAGRTPSPAEPSDGESAVAAEESRSRLQVVGAGQASGTDATASLTDEDLKATASSVRRLQQELTVLRESEAELRSENAELRRMAEEMRQRMQALERALNVPADVSMPDVPEAPASSAGTEEAGTAEGPAAATTPAPAAVAEEPEVTDEPSSRGTPRADEPKAAPAEPPAPATPPEVEPFTPDTQAPWEDPMLQMAGGGILLVLLVLLMLVMRRRRRARDDDDAILAGAALGLTDSAADREDDDTLAGSTAAASGSDEMQDDPLEQAETYMSYGRYDQTADAIARGLDAGPDNPELRLRMLEIHALNHDRGAFEADAQELYGLVDGQNDPIWQRASELGREIAPENPLFSSGDDFGASGFAETPRNDSLDEALDLGGAGDIGGDVDVAPAMTADDSVEEEDDLSDLDFALDEAGDDRTVAPPAEEQAAPEETPETSEDLSSMDFDLESFNSSAHSQKPAASAGLEEAENDDFGLDFEASEPRTETRPAAGDSAPAADADDGGLSFDIDGAGTDDAGAAEGIAAPVATEGDEEDDLFDASDENGTKLDLARAYLDMGDAEGARSLLEEVIEEGNDEQKREAQTLVEQAR